MKFVIASRVAFNVYIPFRIGLTCLIRIPGKIVNYVIFLRGIPEINSDVPFRTLLNRSVPKICHYASTV